MGLSNPTAIEQSLILIEDCLTDGYVMIAMSLYETPY